MATVLLLVGQIEPALEGKHERDVKARILAVVEERGGVGVKERRLPHEHTDTEKEGYVYLERTLLTRKDLERRGGN